MHIFSFFFLLFSSSPSHLKQIQYLAFCACDIQKASFKLFTILFCVHFFSCETGTCAGSIQPVQVLRSVKQMLLSCVRSIQSVNGGQFIYGQFDSFVDLRRSQAAYSVYPHQSKSPQLFNLPLTHILAIDKSTRKSQQGHVSLLPIRNTVG